MNKIPSKNKPSAPASSRLRHLLLILIFTFIASGIGMALLMQVNNYYREQLYGATESALPRHIPAERK